MNTNFYLISDTHFFHSRIIEFGRKQFKHAEEMNEFMIERWNSVVKPHDTIIHLGDFAMGPNIDWAILDRLNGIKTWILGNHDTPAKIEKAQKYFAKICAYLEVQVGSKKILISHIPVHDSQLKRFDFQIHGHLHEELIDDSRYFSVCCEQINYTPIHFSDVLNKLKERNA